MSLSALFVASALIAQQGQGESLGRMYYIGKEETPEAMIVMVRDKRLDSPKIDPKDKLEYEYVVTGYASSPPEAQGNHPIRFRVFSQQRKKVGDPAELACRLLLRLWKYNYERLKLDHSREYNGQIVDVYLSWGGQAGGEQLFTEDTENGRLRPANVIYIYDIASFTDPVEMAREVCHEYGHASLPPVGGFVKPEDWGNGYLGEKLYMRWLRDDTKAGALQPIDTTGASAKDLDAWCQKNADPLLDRVLLNGPDFAALKGSGPLALDSYIGLNLYAQEVLGNPTFARSLKLIAEPKAPAVPTAIFDAVKEAGGAVLAIPARHRGKNIWAPVGNGRVSGGGAVKRNGDWAELKVLTPDSVSVKFPAKN